MQASSIRINYVLTTTRLENLFWDVLAEITSREDKTTNQIDAASYHELFLRRRDSPQFTSFWRVCYSWCLSPPQLDDVAFEHPAFKTLVQAAKALLHH